MPQPKALGAPSSDAQWVKCPSCEAFVYWKRLQRNLRVCPECNYHFRLPARERLKQLVDPGSFDELSSTIEAVDILSFVDSRPYPARLEEARRKTGNREAALYGPATIGGRPLVVVALDFPFMGGSMGGAVGEIVVQAAELALSSRVPLLAVSASGGARMQEGCVSLMQLAKTSQAIAKLHEEGVLYLCLNTDPTFGGVTASFAMLGDILIAEPSSHIGFAGPQVIAQTIHQELPPGFQTAEFLLQHGMLDIVEPRENLRNAIGKILGFHEPPDAGALPAAEAQVPLIEPEQLPDRSPWDVVAAARHIDRPTSLEYIAYIFEEFEELHGDRLFGENSAVVGGLAMLGSLPVVVVGHQKGHTTTEMVKRNFGMPQPEGYRKALRLMQHAAKFGMPLITLVDTPGAYPGIEAEERGQGVAIARSIMGMSRLPVPTVTVVTGEGGSGGALALAVADRVLMMENAYYSVISPEGCSVILWRNVAAAPTAAVALRGTARDLLRLGIINGVVPEPPGGAHLDPLSAAGNVRGALIASLRDLLSMDPKDLLAQRYQRFRALGTPGEQPALIESAAAST